MAEGMAGFHNKSILDRKRLNQSRKSGASPAAQPPMQPCPECNSERLYRDGLRYLNDGSSLQRWLCRSCGYRFSQPNVKINIAGQTVKRPKPRNNLTHNVVSKFDFPSKEAVDGFSFLSGEDVASHECPNVGQHLSSLRDCNRTRQVCDLLTEESKNLAIVARQEPAQREGTKQALDVKGKIIEFLWHLERENKSSKTIVTYRKYLSRLVNVSANLLDPESVKDAIALQKSWGENSKRMATEVYKSFAAFSNLHFEPPRYKARPPLPFIPLESELDALIAGSSKRLSACLQLLKEIPIRIGEALSLKWTEIDSERRIIYVNTTEKDGKPRVFKISEKLLGMVNSLPKKNEKIFGLTGYQYISSQLATTRKRIAGKLQNPRLLQIHFHTFRHWKATMEYNRTRDILYVMRLLGHRCIENTLVYTQLVSFENDQYHSAIAKNIADAQKLVEQGFEFVCQINEATLFRKRK